MKRNKTASTRDLGLDIALIAANYLFKTDHLHYGFWPADLAPEMINLKEAQENYADFVVCHIPSGVKTILDVGSGTGALAKRLIAAGYDVECVSPSPFLTERIRTLIGNTPRIFECKYEEVVTDKRYDLILFSESFQYIKLEKSLSLSNELLQPGGHILISDFFRNETPESGPFGGGHPFVEFQRLIATYPLKMLVDKDITAQTAPNLDMVADCVDRVIAPIKDRLFNYASQVYPFPFRVAKWVFRKPLAHAEEKYFTGKRRGAAFCRYKTYRLMLFQQT